MSAPDGPVGILGGTFDPIHFGHLRLALEAAEVLDLAQVRLIPVGQPPHRVDAQAAAAARARMLQAAVVDEARLVVDTREQRRRGPSYTADTLSELRSELPNAPLCLLLGMDAFVTLCSWHRWQDIPQLAHLCVVHRPGTPAIGAAEVAAELAPLVTEDVRLLRDSPAGRLMYVPVPLLDISASRIRGLIAAGRSPRYLLPDTVLDIIRKHGLYRKPDA